MIETRIIDGKYVRSEKYKELKLRVAQLTKEGVTPHLLVIQVGENQASSVYVRNKARACEKLGIISTIKKLPNDISFSELKSEIIKSNKDNNIHGILVQFPLPKGFDEKEIINLIDPKKDADGLNPLNQGINFTNSNVFAPKPCTPNGIIQMFKQYQIELTGKTVAIIGRSNIVGKPLYNLMVNENAIVTVLHTRAKQKDFKRIISSSDIVVLATGVMDLITPEMVREDVVIIDVGIHKDASGKLRGDVDYKKFIGKASWITPVPGGVGPMTVTMLMENVIALAEESRRG